MKLPISAGILSWGSPKTLHNTLTSYKESGLLNILDEVIIFFQEVTEADHAIAEEFDINYTIQSSANIGIGRAFTELAKASRNKFFIGLENDWVNIENEQITLARLSLGMYLIENGNVDAVRYRHRRNPGDPLYTRTYTGREMDSPMHLIESVHWREHPELLFPDYIQKDPVTHFYIASSQHANFTNNPCLYRRDFYLDNIAPFSGEGIDLEGKIEQYWKENNFTVAAGEGLFTHYRVDR